MSSLPPLAPINDDSELPTLIPFRKSVPDASTIAANRMSATTQQDKAYLLRISALKKANSELKKNTTRQHKIQKHIDNFSQKLIVNAEKFRAALKTQDLEVTAQKLIDKIIMERVDIANQARLKNLPPLVEKELIQNIGEIALLKISAVENKPGVLNGIYKLNNMVITTAKGYGYGGIIMLGELLEDYQYGISVGIDKSYLAAYSMIMTYLFNLIFQFICFMVSPEIYGNMAEPAGTRIMEISGGGRKNRKTRKQSKSTRKFKGGTKHRRHRN